MIGRRQRMIGLRVKTTGDLARHLRNCTDYMLPSLVYPAISSTKLARSAQSWAKEGGLRDE